jgi:8-oxo-dGTP pyrophosphatase MutT (NUDIX family)
MLSLIQSLWGSLVAPMLQRPKHLQMAALCHRGKGASREYLLVTSRDTGRWIIPKGWPIRGLKSNETALREAWEEAGVRSSEAAADPIGKYNYTKRRGNGFEVPVTTLVYSVAVGDLSEEFPEAHERRRKWVSAETAAQLVNETGLKSIFRMQ